MYCIMVFIVFMIIMIIYIYVIKNYLNNCIVYYGYIVVFIFVIL